MIFFKIKSKPLRHLILVEGTLWAILLEKHHLGNTDFATAQLLIFLVVKVEKWDRWSLKASPGVFFQSCFFPCFPLPLNCHSQSNHPPSLCVPPLTSSIALPAPLLTQSGLCSYHSAACLRGLIHSPHPPQPSPGWGQPPDLQLQPLSFSTTMPKTQHLAV